METCENCGCAVYSGRCVNCDEELFIIDQYEELGMQLPAEDSEFIKKANQSKERIKNEKTNRLLLG